MRCRSWWWPLGFLALAVSTTETWADHATSEHVDTQKDGVRLYRRATHATRRVGAVYIDGKLDDQAWAAAPKVTFEWQERPNEGGKPTGATEFQILYDDNALYVGLHALDPEPSRIVGQLFPPLLTRKLGQSDLMAVLLDPMRERRNGYQFAVNPAGVMIDFVLAAGKPSDNSYSAVWDAKTTIDATGWYAEMRIPLSQMRVRNGQQDFWGLQIGRRIARTQEGLWWSPNTSSSGATVENFGNLIFDDTLDIGRAIELVPYVSVGGRFERIPGANQLQDTSEPLIGVGGDLRMRITRGLKLNASVNPDFGQVEADPSEVNLTDQETFFTERRPLFVQDADLYSFGVGTASENLFYSRRIGARPHFSQSGTAPFIDEADVTSIYGASKVSGELGGLRIGVLSSLTGEEVSKAQSPTGQVTSVIAEPMTSYNVAQLSKVLGNGTGEVSAAVTDVHRFLDGTGIDSLHRDAVTGGARYRQKVLGNRWEVSTMVSGSYVAGDPAALLITQRASQRYFQRPDANHVEVDANATRLDGYAFDAMASKIAGNWHGELVIDGRSPGYELNDIGFLVSADVLNPRLTLRYDNTSLAKAEIDSVSASATIESFSDFAPDLLATRALVDGSVSFTDSSSIGAGASFNHGVLDTKLLRGGPAMAGEDSVGGSLFFQTSLLRDFSVRIGGDAIGRAESRSRRLTGSATLLWNIKDNLEVSLQPMVVRNLEDSQYVANAVDALDTSHYVLGRLEQTTLAATARLEYVITPRMSLQLYAQPFMSAGRYRSYKEATRYRASAYEDRFTRYGADQVSESMGQVQIDTDGDGVGDLTFGQPAFKLTSLVSNAVFRWEYRPGSFIHVIWSQARRGFGDGDTLASADLGDVFTSHSANVVLVKLSYWWNP